MKGEPQISQMDADECAVSMGTGRYLLEKAIDTFYLWTRPNAMDIHTLKLELIGKLLEENDADKLEQVKLILDGADSPDRSEEQLSVVNEGFEEYKRDKAKTYTWVEVQRILDEDRRHQEALRHQPGELEVSDAELAVLDERRERHLKGESRSYSWDQVEEILKNDLKR